MGEAFFQKSFRERRLFEKRRHPKTSIISIRGLPESRFPSGCFPLVRIAYRWANGRCAKKAQQG
ncbi:hypothetical protein D3W54_06000 [Komagataeibacter medellinensis]|uniref:Transposase n=1 Tax=Komagataeibacter medellinensis TaxID=1177712 RepID=A0ABQ6VUI5_9PROT|nr:hypothetical protein D3W54_06000 [Komagataeibacter medellinensis]